MNITFRCHGCHHQQSDWLRGYCRPIQRSAQRWNKCCTMNSLLQVLYSSLEPYCCIQVKEGHTPKEHRWGGHLPSIGHWACRWINHYHLWRMASHHQTCGYLVSLSWYSYAYPQRDGQAELTWVASYIPR